MVSAIGSAVQGLAAAGARIESAANKIANSSTSKPTAAVKPVNHVDQVTLSDEATKAIHNDNEVNQKAQAAKAQVTQAQNDPTDALIELKTASVAFKANLKVIEAQQNNDKALLDIKA